MTDFYQITCSRCKKQDTVPFKPNPNKPILCKDCFTDDHPAPRPVSQPENGTSQGRAQPNGRDEIMARMSAWRGLCELVATCRGDIADKVTDVTDLVPLTTQYIIDGSKETLEKLSKLLDEFKKKDDE